MQLIRNLHSFRHVYRRSLYDKQNMVIFVPIPKNASTSLEHFMVGKITGEFINQDFPTIKRSLIKYRLHNVCKNPIESYIAYKKSIKFTIIRDPIERFTSARDMLFSRPKWRATMESKIGLTLNKENCTSVILKYLSEVKIPDAHFRPQSYFISGIKFDCKIKLGKDNIIDTLSKSGLGNWIDGLVDQKLNEGIKPQISLTAKQIKFLNEYYEHDRQLFDS